MDSKQIFKQIIAYKDEPTGVTFKPFGDPVQTEAGEVIKTHAVSDGEIVGRAAFTFNGNDLEVTKVNLGSMAGQGIMGRWADYFMPLLKQGGVDRVSASGYGGAVPICERHGLRKTGDSAELSIRMQQWEPPSE